MRVGVREGFPYRSVKLVLLANDNRYEPDSNTIFKVVNPSIHSKYCPVPTPTFFDTHSPSVVSGYDRATLYLFLQRPCMEFFFILVNDYTNTNSI